MQRINLYILYRIEYCLSKIHVYVEPENVTLFENSVFEGIISKDEAMLAEGNPWIWWLVSLSEGREDTHGDTVKKST